MAAQGPNERNLDAGSRLILEELRDLRLEMRADRRHADEERHRADEERHRADEERHEERRRSDERFERMMRDFQRDSARREAATQRAFAATQRAFKDIRTVGLSIVKTLNHHTRLLERIDRKLGAWVNGRPGQGDSGRAHPRS
jgi:hypothetical protein